MVSPPALAASSRPVAVTHRQWASPCHGDSRRHARGSTTSTSALSDPASTRVPSHAAPTSAATARARQRHARLSSAIRRIGSPSSSPCRISQQPTTVPVRPTPPQQWTYTVRAAVDRLVDVVEDPRHVRNRRRAHVDDRMRDPASPASEEPRVRLERVGGVRQVDERGDAVPDERTDPAPGLVGLRRPRVLACEQPVGGPVAERIGSLTIRRRYLGRARDGSASVRFAPWTPTLSSSACSAACWRSSARRPTSTRSRSTRSASPATRRRTATRRGVRRARDPRRAPAARAPRLDEARERRGEPRGEVPAALRRRARARRRRDRQCSASSCCADRKRPASSTSGRPGSIAFPGLEAVHATLDRLARASSSSGSSAGPVRRRSATATCSTVRSRLPSGRATPATGRCRTGACSARSRGARCGPGGRGREATHTPCAALPARRPAAVGLRRAYSSPERDRSSILTTQQAPRRAATTRSKASPADHTSPRGRPNGEWWKLRGRGTTYATRAILLRAVLVGRRAHADSGPRGRGPESPAHQEGHGSPVGPRVADGSTPERRERQRRLVLVRELRAERRRRRSSGPRPRRRRVAAARRRPYPRARYPRAS